MPLGGTKWNIGARSLNRRCPIRLNRLIHTAYNVRQGAIPCGSTSSRDLARTQRVDLDGERILSI